MSTSRAPQLLVGLDQVLSSVTVLTCSCAPAHTPGPNLVTSLHCQVPVPRTAATVVHTDSQSPRSCQGAYSCPSRCCQPWCLPLRVTTTHPCHCVSTFSWALQLSVCTPWGLITTAASPSPYLLDLKVPLRTLWPLQPVRIPQSTHQRPHG